MMPSLLLAIVLLVSLSTCCSYIIDNIIQPMRVSLLRTLQLDKEDWIEQQQHQQQQQQQQLQQQQHDNEGLNTRQKRLLNIYKKSIDDKTNIFGFTASSELVNGRIAMVSFLICFFIEDMTDESILDQIGLLEHEFHVSLYMLLLTLTVQPMVSFFKDDRVHK